MGTPTSYEEQRRQRVEANKKLLLNLGLQQLSNNLAQTVSSESKSKKREVKSQKPKQEWPVERRFSTRVSRLPTPIYREVDVDFPRPRKSRVSYDSNRFLHSTSASYEARMQAKENAEKIMKDLGSKNPFFIKSLVRSHVSSCFWLGLPADFCQKHLPQKGETMVLEDEKGEEFDAVYIARRTGLSGGWKGFALDHDLDNGDAVVFELVEPTRFKVYISKAKDFEPNTTSKVSSMNGNLEKKSDAATKLAEKKTSNLKTEKENSIREKETTNSKGKGRSGNAASSILNLEKGNENKIKVPVTQTCHRNITMSQSPNNVNNGDDHDKKIGTHNQSTRAKKRSRVM